ncbi:ferritin-like domain-containing protein [Paracraurococcus lichenis]|uniref:Ferritin-like domain-containing protein n=1 Tax=Paracraurococcus lichenis TaxID=3064888 RepID=A0ABT9ECQ7_9PROT|nr:ferritin-like domain-containing protein [Paracraurococcus sp. LOR1-02]MDO9714006.1 ferritin-like domain-containing protein [Paracraurococcus sp. LOR1-02]
MSHDEGNAGAQAGRRGFLGRAGLGAAALGTLAVQAARPAPAAAQAALTDADILNFALNLEYLEAEFYLRAVTGQGLPASATGGTGTQGTVTGGSQVPFRHKRAREFAEEIAQDEMNHVLFLRQALGEAAVAEPSIDLANSFTAAAQAAGVIGPGESFDPFTDEQSFLLGAFLFEDVGVTAYSGAAAFIQDKGILTAAAGILAVEAYHAGEIRTRLINQDLVAPAGLISALRASASGRADDQGVLLDKHVNVVPTDANGLAFTRTPQQVLNIVYLGGSAAGFGFFPNRLNGTIA